MAKHADETKKLALDYASVVVADYNHRAPHSGLGYRSPVEFRALKAEKSDTGCLAK